MRFQIVTRPSPKLDALRAMREAQFTGQARSRPPVAALREAITSTEDDMAKRKAKKKAPKPVKRKAVKVKATKVVKKAKASRPRPPKAPPADAALTPTEQALRDALKARPLSREQINADFGWSDHTARATLSRVKAKLAAIGEKLTKAKTAGTNFYRVA